jgi:hypothetical protein
MFYVFDVLKDLPFYTDFLKRKKWGRVIDVSLIVLDFLFAQDFAESSVTLGTFEEAYFELHAFACFVWSSCHLPRFLWLGIFSSAFWTFCHTVFPP